MNFVLAQQRLLLTPLYCAYFIVNSEPHNGARPSVRLCVGLIKLRVFAVMAINFVHARSYGVTPPKLFRVRGMLGSMTANIAEYFTI